MLPKISYPINEIKLESVSKPIRYRPMLVKEEKILLMAKASDNENDIFTAIKQIVNNCVIDEKFDIDKLPLFELEYFFLILRVQSVGDSVDLSYHDNEDDKDYKFSIKLDQIKIKYPEGKIDKKIALNENIGVVMMYPPASLYDNKKFIDGTNVDDISEELLIASIEKIYDADNVYDPKQATPQEMKEFIESIDSLSYKKIQNFLINVPSMEHIIEYKNSKGTERKIVLKTLNDFFIF